ncbi:hypothetical protein DFH94DRAFT_678900 [Russula ochroleuca]|uniref:Uncharacterized protein n=1 Tax=Russula ochroleuca TaxID=152965 RepID=A0A9P5N4H7_9AGAM|nr:hypothetical protein DFH94DRAFT_678900 [Russula ochroleuca]
MYQHAKRDIHNFSEFKYRMNFHQSAHPTRTMATPLRKVSENFYLTVKRAKIATVVSPYLAKASSERSKSARANPIGTRGVTRPSAEVQNGYRSNSSFTPLPREGIYPPGLYTAIVHNGPLRTRIQDHLDEIEEFKAHTRCAQELIFGWLVTLYYLVLVVAWNALGRFYSPPEGVYSPPSRRSLQVPRNVTRVHYISRSSISYLDRHPAVVWFLPTLPATQKSVLEANSRLRSDFEVNGLQRSTFEAQRMSLGTLVHAKFVNGPQHSILRRPFFTLSRSRLRELDLVAEKKSSRWSP